MNEMLERDPRILWSFWLACGLAVTGGLAPLVLATGGPSRLAGAIFPYAVAAAAMAANAITYRRGRSLATLLYFLAGVAIVYGMLLMFAVPLRLAVTGTCPDPPAACPDGLERAFSSGEATGFAVAVFAGVLSILTGFFGLLMLYRRRPQASTMPPLTRVIPSRAETVSTPPDVAPKSAAEVAPEPAAEASAEVAPEPPSAGPPAAPPSKQPA
jgi:hypothetical protein